MARLTRRLVRFRVKGLDRLGKKFRSLDAAARRKILPRAIIAGMEPIGQAIEDRAPVGPSRGSMNGFPAVALGSCLRLDIPVACRFDQAPEG